jgi:ABC-type Fe3+-hydroxamate transport system substrate-binding protein
MAVFKDQMSREVEINTAPQRIISIVPSQTELLCDLGLNEEVLGITKFCVHPKEWFQSKTKIGGTKKLDMQKIKSLQPDLIIANKEENEKTQVEELAKYFPVWISDVNNLDDAFDMIHSIGGITSKLRKAEEIINKIRSHFDELKSAASAKALLQEQYPHPPACYLIWRDPYMTVGGDSFIDDMMQRCGFENIYHHKLRYPHTSVSEMQEMNCRLILLSSEPYPFKQQHVHELQEALPHAMILLVDGEMFSWYGSRLIKAPAYFEQLQIQVLSLAHAAGNR